MVLKLHGVAMSPNVVRVMAALNEKGLDFEFVHVDMRAGAHKKPEFLALNPFGQVPAFEDGDLKLFESRAINRYIAIYYKGSGTDLLPAKAQAEIAATEVWLEVESQHLYQPIYKLCFELLIKPMLGMVVDEAAAETYAAELAKVLDVYEDRLSKCKYVAGGEFTLADLNMVSWVHLLLKSAKADLITSRPHVTAWWETVSARPAWQKTVAEAAEAAAS